jgi:dipeptidyl-peptidase-3
MTLGRLIPLAVAGILLAPAPTSPLVARVGDTGFIQLEAPSFAQLTAKQKALAYYLTQASIAIDPIVYDQLSRFGIREKRLLEGIVSHDEGIEGTAFGKIKNYALLSWANRGNHNETTAQKFLPAFTADELTAAALKAQANGAFKTPYADLPALPSADALKKELADLNAAVFDARFEPMTTAKTPPAGTDIVQASANTFYQGVTLADLKGFTEHFPLNSRVVKDAKGIREEVYRAGTPDGKVPPGLYAAYLKKANEYLQRAAENADPAQATVIGDLIRFYQTGDPKDWLQFGADWVRNDAPVDFANGFIEVYRDPRAAKGTSQSFVSITDEKMNQLMLKLAANAQYFEDRAPWAQQYKKQGVKAPMAKASETLIETGDFHVSTVGDNLPNENEIREKYGSKSFLLTGSSRTLR